MKANAGKSYRMQKTSFNEYVVNTFFHLSLQNNLRMLLHGFSGNPIHDCPVAYSFLLAFIEKIAAGCF